MGIATEAFYKKWINSPYMDCYGIYIRIATNAILRISISSRDSVDNRLSIGEIYNDSLWIIYNGGLYRRSFMDNLQ
jgi:hypothetical protein